MCPYKYERTRHYAPALPKPHVPPLRTSVREASPTRGELEYRVHLWCHIYFKLFTQTFMSIFMFTYTRLCIWRDRHVYDAASLGSHRVCVRSPVPRVRAHMPYFTDLLLRCFGFHQQPHP
jgi:hypothetical protein